MADVEAIRAYLANTEARCGDCDKDLVMAESYARALLAEVDRLNLRIETLIATMEVIKAAVASPSPGIDDSLLADLRKALP